MTVDSATDTAPYLIRRQDGKAYLVDTGRRRAIRSGLLAAGLEQIFPDRGVLDDAGLDRIPEGVPVEVFLTEGAAPFLVVNGHRMPVRGLPVPRRVADEVLATTPAGPVLDVAASNISRRRLTAAAPPPLTRRVARSLRKRGVLGIATEAARRTRRSLSTTTS
jgi:hypothetical protein